MKKIALLLMLSAPLTYAETPKVCQILGDMAYEIAKGRDEGVSKYAFRNQTWDTDDKNFRNIALEMIEAIYRKPYFSPEKETEMVVEACIKAVRKQI